MSQTKYKLPPDIKKSVLGYIQGYKRRLNWYQDEISNIVYETPQRFEEYNLTDKTNGTGRVYLPKGNTNGDSTASKAEQLGYLENHHEVKIMRAIEQAKNCIGMDLNEKDQQEIIKAIWNSCIYGRRFYLDVYDLPMCRDSFYERKRKFIHDIASKLNMI